MTRDVSRAKRILKETGEELSVSGERSRHLHGRAAIEAVDGKEQ